MTISFPSRQISGGFPIEIVGFPGSACSQSRLCNQPDLLWPMCTSDFKTVPTLDLVSGVNFMHNLQCELSYGTVMWLAYGRLLY
jgi:hypothetical protein